MQKVSVIVPFYKGNVYMDRLFRSIKSNMEHLVKRQMNVNVELVVVNDSPEVSVEIPSNVGEIEYRVINQPINMGIHQARVSGLYVCNGDYVLFLDQDDEISDKFIADQMNKIGNSDLIVCNAMLESSDGSCRPLYKNIYEFEKIKRVDTYIKSHNQIASPGQCLIKKSAIPCEWCEFIMKTNGSDDLFLWLLMLYKERKISFNLEKLYVHKYTGNNLSASEAKMCESSLEVLQYLKKIECVDKDDLQVLKRSRELGRNWQYYTLIQKIQKIWVNRDIFVAKIYWKINSILFSMCKK